MTAVLDLLTDREFLSILVGVFVFMAARRWWHFYRHGKARDEQMAALTPLADSLGGTVTGPEEATAWSAEVQPPLASEVAGLGRAFQRSVPRFDLALDFRRGPWHVRVTEAAVRVAGSPVNGLGWLQEHRIEVATARLAPMKVLRPVRFDHRGNPRSPGELKKVRYEGWLARRPLTVEREQAEWHPVALMPPLDEDFYAYGSDVAAAARSFHPDAHKWLMAQEDDLPGWARHLGLTFEAGLVYAVFPDHIYPDQLMHVVDTIVGLLDRMPGVRPRHAAATA